MTEIKTEIIQGKPIETKFVKINGDMFIERRSLVSILKTDEITCLRISDANGNSGVASSMANYIKNLIDRLEKLS